ncbi:MAG: D-glycero-beta-D-manno-heptose-7-phosphate kinase [Bacteroidetes bacterium]|nr:D-glycero-beta-D-manno-heptose-7-phosphate kinase [Bacteroidota bacterium]
MKVLIVGDVMVDSYIIGKVTRMSPEAPVPVVDVQSYDMRLGGAGNVALNVQAMGGIPILCSALGNDTEGTELKSLLAAAGLTDRAILVSDKRKTTKKTRVIGNNHQLVRIDHEITLDLDTLDSFLLEQHFDRELEHVDVVVLQDYNKGVLHAANIPALIARAIKAGKPIVVDPKRENFLAYKGATLFKPNLKELKEGLELDSDFSVMDNVKAAVHSLHQQLGSAITMVTMSERGVLVYTGTEEHTIPAHLRRIVDVSGAGDTVISVAAMCLAAGAPARVMAEISNLAGGLVCEETGVVPVNKDRLLEEAEKVI